MSRPTPRTLDLGSVAEPLSERGLSDEDFEAALQKERGQRGAQSQLKRDEPVMPPFTPEPELSVEQMQAELAELEKDEQARSLRAELKARRAKLAAQQAARAAVPTYDADRDSPQTWILMPHGQEEASIAEGWIEEHCPVKLEQRMLGTMLDLAMLRQDDNVICMVRGKGKRSPLPRNEFKINHEGERMTEPRRPEELYAEMVLTPAIRCTDHWVPGTSRGRYSGSLNRVTFLEAVGAACSPLQIKFQDVCSCKNGELPRELVLREV